MSNNLLSTQPYKGTRDFYPAEMRFRNWFFDKIREALLLSAYEEYNAPMIEELDLYIAKSGEEIAKKQTYNFTDRGDRQLCRRILYGFGFRRRHTNQHGCQCQNQHDRNEDSFDT